MNHADWFESLNEVLLPHNLNVVGWSGVVWEGSMQFNESQFILLLQFQVGLSDALNIIAPR